MKCFLAYNIAQVLEFVNLFNDFITYGDMNSNRTYTITNLNLLSVVKFLARITGYKKYT